MRSPRLHTCQLGELTLEGGAKVPDFRMTCITHGTLDADGSNAILSLHGLRGNRHSQTFWVGPDRALDPDRYFIVQPDTMGVASLGSWERHVEKAFAVTVADLMTAEVHTATTASTVHEAAKLMAHEDVPQLPVVGEDGRYAGMLTRVGVIRALDRFEFGGGAG